MLNKFYLYLMNGSIESTHQLHLNTTNTINGPIKQCRICFDSEQSTRQQMISPCQCRGSAEYVHKQCLEKWLLNVLNIGYLNPQHQQHDHKLTRKCQICHYEIQFSVSLEYKCKKCDKLTQYIVENRLLAIIATLVSFLNAGSLGFVIYLSVFYKISFQSGKILQSSLLVFSLLICIVMACLTTKFIVQELVFERVNHIEFGELIV